MRIIKEGNPNPITFHCKACGCVFEANRREYAILDYTPDFDIDHVENRVLTLIPKENIRYQCKCPDCNGEVNVNALEAEKEREKRKC